MANSRFDFLSSFLRKRYKLVLVAWVIALIIFGSQIPAFFGAVSYNIAGSNFGGPTNAESQVAQNIIDEQFPTPANSTSGNGIIVVLQNHQMYSSSVQSALFGLNKTLAGDPALSGTFQGMESIYTTEGSILSSVLPSLVSQTSQLNESVALTNSGANQLFTNDVLLEQGIAGINQSAQLVYGVPSEFLQVWSTALSQCSGSVSCADSAANQTISSQLGGPGSDPLSQGYFQAFLGAWNASFASEPNPASPSPVDREQASVEQAVSAVSVGPGISAQEAQTLEVVAHSMNATDFYQSGALVNATVAAFQPQFPAGFSSSLGVSLDSLVSGLVALGPSPSNSTILTYTLQVMTNSVSSSLGSSSSSSSGSPGFSASQLVSEAYALGKSPSSNATWSLAASIVTNATTASFASSPLFTARPSSLFSLLSSFSTGGNSSARISAKITDLIQAENYQDYPLILSTSITRTFVSPDNGTMLVVYNFAVPPTDSMIAAFRSDVSSSQVPALGTYYVTGGPVITSDISKIFGPVLGVTIGPGVAASLVIVALLLLAPLAAIVPVLIGGIAIAISLPVIYYGVVDIGHGTLTFLTPTLTILLVLGLAVDYSVLQLRRTKEERIKGNSLEDSVAISLRWAGQAVLTAGITVVVAYIVMAIANVPLFSGVGTAIAIAVSILIAAALTLLPSLELLLKDRLFWPGLKRQLRQQPSLKKRSSRVRRLSRATLRNKVVIMGVVSVIAVAALAITYSTPTSSDLLKLFPDFPSNHGLTVINDNLGSSTTSPTIIVVTTSTPIVNGNGQFNQTLMDRLEAISSTASSVSGVNYVSGPTRPYGSPFNYSGVESLPQPEKSQYLSAMFSDIGKNNATAEIFVGLQSDSQSNAAISTLLKVESSIAKLPHVSGVTVYYAGNTQSTYDNQAFLNGILPEVIIVLSIAIYAILLVQLRSVFTPLRLVFTILCSVTFSLALLAFIYFYTLNLPILDFAPLFVVVTMLGVGIDYDIFLVTRIREEAMKGKSDDNAIKTAMERTWVTIFGLGLVLATVFSSLVITDIALLQEIGFVVAAAIIVDVGIVILFFVPGLMGIAERFNWWPSSLTKRAVVSKDEDDEDDQGAVSSSTAQATSA